jgi:hypothetical protein
MTTRALVSPTAKPLGPLQEAMANGIAATPDRRADLILHQPVAGHQTVYVRKR